jgi:hypothetical protein
MGSLSRSSLIPWPAPLCGEWNGTIDPELLTMWPALHRKSARISPIGPPPNLVDLNWPVADLDGVMSAARSMDLNGNGGDPLRLDTACTGTVTIPNVPAQFLQPFLRLR